jgi:hypothetical protein
MASTNSNVEIYAGSNDALNMLHVPIASATTVAPGDLLKFSGGAAACVSASSDNTAFIGLSLDCSENGETQDINVLLRGRAIFTVTSAVYTVGEALTYASGANGADWALAAVTSGADGLFWSLQYNASAVTTLKVQWDSFFVGASIGTGSGFWEGFAS